MYGRKYRLKTDLGLINLECTTLRFLLRQQVACPQAACQQVDPIFD